MKVFVLFVGLLMMVPVFALGAGKIDNYRDMMGPYPDSPKRPDYEDATSSVCRTMDIDNEAMRETKRKKVIFITLTPRLLSMHM